MSLDPEARTAKLQGGEEVAFGKALLATGAIVNILRVEGAENEGIHYLRAFGNSDAIRADAEAAEHVVLIGGSYIGAEVAASLTAKGTKCTIVMMEDVALSRTFGERRRALVPGAARSARGRVPRRRGAGGLRGRRPGRGGGHEERAQRSSATRSSSAPASAPTRCSPSGPGSRSTTGSSATRSCRPRSPGIYAAGDCCSYDSVVHGRRLRVEHWDVAMQQGMHAARNMLGEDARLRRRALLLQRPRRLGEPRVRRPGAASGTRRSGAATATRGEFSVWYLKGGRVAGALSVGRSEDLAEARRMLADGVDVSGAERADRRRRQRSLGDRRLSSPGAQGILRAHVAPWCNGSTPRSGRGSRGSSPWGAASNPCISRRVDSLCYASPPR